MKDTIDALNRRIEELEAAIVAAKTGHLLGPLAARLGIRLDAARCKWNSGGREYRTFDAALGHALHVLTKDVLALGNAWPEPAPEPILPPPTTVVDRPAVYISGGAPPEYSVSQVSPVPGEWTYSGPTAPQK